MHVGIDCSRFHERTDLNKLKYEKVGVLPIWIVKSNVSSVGPSSESNLLKLSVLAVHQPFHISICTSTLPTQHTAFIRLEQRCWNHHDKSTAVFVPLTYIYNWTACTPRKMSPLFFHKMADL